MDIVTSEKLNLQLTSNLNNNYSIDFYIKSTYFLQIDVYLQDKITYEENFTLENIKTLSKYFSMCNLISEVLISLKPNIENNSNIKLLEESNHLNLIIPLNHPLSPQISFNIRKKKDISEKINDIYRIIEKQQNEINQLKKENKRQQNLINDQKKDIFNLKGKYKNLEIKIKNLEQHKNNVQHKKEESNKNLEEEKNKVQIKKEENEKTSEEEKNKVQIKKEENDKNSEEEKKNGYTKKEENDKNSEEEKENVHNQKGKEKLDSIIINNDDEKVKVIKEWINPNKNISFELLFRKNKDGPKEFHNKCDNKGPTLTLIETDKGKKFGGYTPINWGTNINDSENITDEITFLFSLNSMKKYIKCDKGNSIYSHKIRGPSFGSGVDLYIYNNLNEGNGNSGNFLKNNELTDGEKTFKVKEIEVFKVEFN